MDVHDGKKQPRMWSVACQQLKNFAIDILLSLRGFSRRNPEYEICNPDDISTI